MKAINNYIQEGFYKNTNASEITLDILNDYIESIARKNGFKFVGEHWDTKHVETIDKQIRRYEFSYDKLREHYELGFVINENTEEEKRSVYGYYSFLKLQIDTWYDTIEKRPRYTIDLKLSQPAPRKGYTCMSFHKGFYSKKCDIKWYPSAQEEIEKVISMLASLEETFEKSFRREIDKSRTFSKASFGKILNHFSQWLHTY